MAYSRWYNSDLYIFEHVNIGLVCFGCALYGKDFRERGEMVKITSEEHLREHIKAHKEAGHSFDENLAEVIISSKPTWSQDD